MGLIAQSVASTTADPQVMGLAHSLTFVEINHETIFTAIILLPLIYEGQLLVTSGSTSSYYWLTA